VVLVPCLGDAEIDVGPSPANQGRQAREAVSKPRRHHAIGAGPLLVLEDDPRLVAAHEPGERRRAASDRMRESPDGVALGRIGHPVADAQAGALPACERGPVTGRGGAGGQRNAEEGEKGKASAHRETGAGIVRWFASPGQATA